MLDPVFLAALASAGGRLGFGDRTTAMRAIFAEALPDAVLSRPTKARYSEAFWGQRTREFAARWQGGGVDDELVDPAALKTEWLKANPHEDSAMLLHAAWLSEQS
jgi:asparagine synthase (glutamine-hydrolysing)